MPGLIEVAAAVLQRPANTSEKLTFATPMLTLAVRRSEGAMHGYWEFPGGKRESQESMSCCLEREIDEELGLKIQVGDFLGVNAHTTADGKMIELHAYRVRHWSGNIRLTVHDKMRWLNVAELDTVRWSPADIPFVDMLKS